MHDAKDLSEYQNIIFLFGLFIIAKKLLVRNHPPVWYRGDQLIRTNLCSGRINRNANIQFNWNIEIIPSGISVSIDFPAPYSEKMCKHCLWFEKKKNKPYEVLGAAQFKLHCRKTGFSSFIYKERALSTDWIKPFLLNSDLNQF